MSTDTDTTRPAPAPRTATPPPAAAVDETEIPQRMARPAVYAARTQNAIDLADKAWFDGEGDRELSLAYLAEAEIHARLAQAAATEAVAHGG